MSYKGKGRDLLLRFKHADAIHGAYTYAQWMIRAGGDVLQHADLLLPVPLHWRRLFWRQYNQAALLANAIGRLSKIPVKTTLLRRNRATASQGYLNSVQRKHNVAHAFFIPERLHLHLRGKRVVLIDDVLTTGATVNECARLLKKVGVFKVDVLSLGRVI